MIALALRYCRSSDWQEGILHATRLRLDFFVDSSTICGMATNTKTTRTPRVRRIVGFSLAPSLAGEVKAEAGRRGISLRKLFEELWALYKQQPRAKS